MDDYKMMYSIMFNAATDAIEKIEQGDNISAVLLLMAAQCRCEELYITGTCEE